MGLVAAGGVLGALAATSCCIVPLVLFDLGVSGAWIANLTQLAPYQPYFITATVACLAGGYGVMYRARKVACADGQGVHPAPVKPDRHGRPDPRDDPRHRRVGV